MFKRVADEVGAITRGMREVEEAVGLRGRKYYGAFDDSGEYRVCVQLRDDDDPQAIGLEVGSLPGGRHALQRLTGEPPEVYERIGPTFQRLSERPDRDPSTRSMIATRCDDPANARGSRYPLDAEVASDRSGCCGREGPLCPPRAAPGPSGTNRGSRHPRHARRRLALGVPGRLVGVVFPWRNRFQPRRAGFF